MSNFRFTPYSIEAFKRIARDIQRTYPLAIQQSQEALARAFGYVDLHALQEHLKTGPKPGAHGDNAGFATLTVDSNFLHVVEEMYGRDASMPKGRRTFRDLCATWNPERRRQAVAFQDEIDLIIDGRSAPEPDTPTSDYVTFEERPLAFVDSDDEQSVREGLFIVSEKADAARQALQWIDRALDGAAYRGDGERHAQLFQRLGQMLQLMPNNPYVLATWLDYSRFSLLGEEGELPELDELTAEQVDEASLIWGLAKDCRGMFDALMPRNFRGRIIPRLTGVRIENEAYFKVLYAGALAALTLGHAATAVAWARRSLALDPDDDSGAREILELASAALN